MDDTAAPRSTRPFAALLVANGISWAGNVLARLAIPWFVLETTGSAARAGLTSFFQTVPFIIAAFLGGTFIDWVGPKSASVAADVASGATLASIPFLYAIGALEFWHLLVLVFLGGLLDTPGSTARQALLPDVAHLAGVGLERANSMYSFVEGAALLLGAPLAGVLIGTLGATNLLWLDAASFGASALIYALLIPSRLATVAEGRRFLRDIAQGLRFIRHQPLILAFLITSVIGNFLSAPLFAVVLPVHVRQAYGDARNLGLMIAAFGLGGLAGVSLYGAIGYRLRRRALYVTGWVGFALGVAVLVTLPPLPVILGALSVAGFLSAPINPIVNTVRQERTPTQMRGRVFGTVQACNMIAAPIGLLVGGVVTERFGVRTGLIAIMAGYVIIVVVSVANTAIRAMDGLRAPADTNGPRPA